VNLEALAMHGFPTPEAAIADYFETYSKKGRGMAQRSLDLIEAMYTGAEAAQPITGRGIGYKLFTARLIPSMAKNEMQRVYRLLKEAREQGTIPWEWIVDETRELERVSTWSDPEEYARCVAQSYRRDFWNQLSPRRGVERKGHGARRARPSAQQIRRRLPRDARV
jgi:hypothetical protein